MTIESIKRIAQLKAISAEVETKLAGNACSSKNTHSKENDIDISSYWWLVRQEEKIMTIEVADRLVKLRKKYGYSQEELADKLGLSRQAVSKWERAEASPDTDNLICLAKLYGVSLDELLATDEDIDTIVKEQVKDEQKIETEDRTEETKKKDSVVINHKGIFVQDKDGSTVSIGKGGITCKDGDGLIVKNEKPDRVMGIIGAIEGALFVLAATAYLLLGTLLDLWDCAWVVFFIPEILCSPARAIRKKDAQKFNMAFTACFTYFFLCMWLPHYVSGLDLWGKIWPIFLSIPVYHTMIGAINKIVGKKDEDDDEDEDDDDEDEDEDDKGKIIDVHIETKK